MEFKKEPKEVDFLIRSKPWTDVELIEFRGLMQKLKLKNKPANISPVKTPRKISRSRKAA